DHVLFAQSHLDVQPQAGHRGRAGSANDDSHFADFFAGDFQRVLQGGGGDDRGAVLIVVEDGDLHLFLESILDLETRWRGDVLEIDPAERRLHQLDGPDELFGVARFELEVEDVDVGEALEENGLSFHHRFSRARTDVAEAEDGGAVRDDGDEVAAI